MQKPVCEPHKPGFYAADLGPLLASISNARVVLLGEASHNTYEYDTWRTAVTTRLLQEDGFQVMAVAGPPATPGMLP